MEDPLDVLPDEIAEKVLLELDVHTLLSCCMVSKKWNIVCNYNGLWKNLCLQKYWTDCGALNKYINRFGFLEPERREAFHSMCEWKKHYILRNQIRNNWHSHNVTNLRIKQVEGTQEAFTTCVFCNGSILLFGLNIGIVKIFDLEDEARGAVILKCALGATPVKMVQMAGSHVVVVQSAYLLVYRFNEHLTSLKLHAAKFVQDDVIKNVGVTESKPPEEHNLALFNFMFDINDKYFVLVSNEVTIDVYKWDCSLQEPVKNIFNECSKICCLRLVNDILYFIVRDNITEENANFYLHAYSLDLEYILYVTLLFTDTYCIYSNFTLSLETNELYIVLLINNDIGAVIINRLTGNRLFHVMNTSFFLNANSDPHLVGMSVDDCLFVINPLDQSNYQCYPMLSGLPIAMQSDIIVTRCNEYDRLGIDTLQIEFWNTKLQTSIPPVLVFVTKPETELKYGDYKMLVFIGKESSLVQSYIA